MENRKGFKNRLIIVVCLCLINLNLYAQNSYTNQESEYIIVGSLKGDQVFADADVRTNGGYLVWQDNATDGIGMGISACKLDSSFSRQYGFFRVNQQGSGEQRNPAVALLSNGGAVFVWEGTQSGNSDIYASFLSSSGTFITGDIRVNIYTNNDQILPAVCALPENRVLVAWTSFGQDGSMNGVYGRIFSGNGTPITGEFQINQTTLYNQRTPSVACLANGNIIAIWISELQRGERNIDVFGRLFNSNGEVLGDEFMINTGTNICGNPRVAATADGGFVVVWAERSPIIKSTQVQTSVNGWDIFGRAYTPGMKAINQPIRINTFVYGDQFAPRIAVSGNDLMIVWTSLGQDGSAEGVFGRFIDYNCSFISPEFRVNTTTALAQKYPVVASDREGGFLVVWSSFTGIDNGMDLFAQRYSIISAPLPAPSAPVVSALSQSRLSITWAEVSGFNIVGYEVYMDGASDGVRVTSNYYTATGLAPGSVHTFAIAYILADGRKSPLSPAASGKTWGEDLNMDGLPDDWQAAHWGSNPALWQPGNVDSDGDGATNLQEFLAGTNPVDPRSVLRTRISRSPQGRFLHWNTQPGLIYQVQTSTDLKQWINVGQPRFAAGYQDSILIEQTNMNSFYRVIRIR
ncbi:MAG: fibronectin type III domain-containing protein [Verrucomicrobiae bacterium]|nr:fibronectin type III domain-containing protein [Verrucomicrobiae bacterium]